MKLLHLVFIIVLFQFMNFADCFDPLDPEGNITVTFDIIKWTDDGYIVRVRLQNYYQYRQIDSPGWRLAWIWANDEVIWSMSGALATHQGSCSDSGLTSRIPHSCRKDPVIADQNQDASGENRTDSCCRDGNLSGRAIDRPNSFSLFNMVVGNLGSGGNNSFPPNNLTMLAPGLGYTCSPLAVVPSSVNMVERGKREEQVLRTWQSTCTYSPFVANYTPTCCVSLSAFYNPHITPCPACSCSCQDTTEGVCQLAKAAKVDPRYIMSDLKDPGTAICTANMCPVRVHWHVKTNYRKQWRVKVTVSNYRYVYNYSDWNLVVQHPSFAQGFRAYSFNSTSLSSTVGGMDDAAIFWGLPFYNTELPEAENNNPSSVSSDILIDKDQDSFTLHSGWALPRRIYFNGDQCEMPMPDNFPGLPNISPSLLVTNNIFLFFLLYLVILF